MKLFYQNTALPFLTISFCIYYLQDIFKDIAKNLCEALENTNEWITFAVKGICTVQLDLILINYRFMIISGIWQV